MTTLTEATPAAGHPAPGVPRTSSLSEVLRLSAMAGVTITRSIAAAATLYVWVTPVQERILYIGKLADESRIKNEARWKEADPTTGVYSAICALLKANDAIAVPLSYRTNIDFDKAHAARLLEAAHARVPHWPFEQSLGWLHDDSDVSPWKIEKFLIRLVVRQGSLVGNSQHASQWENPIGAGTDGLAAAALLADAGHICL